MDVRILLGMVFLVFVVIVASRLALFLFGVSIGQYNLLIALVILLVVITVMALMIKKLLRERDFTY